MRRCGLRDCSGQSHGAGNTRSQHLLVALLITALSACGDPGADSAKASASNCQMRSTPFDRPESGLASGSSSDAFAFSGFRLGADAAQVEKTVRFANEHFANAVYDALGGGQYFIVRLVHGTEDTSTTYAMTVEAFSRSK